MGVGDVSKGKGNIDSCDATRSIVLNRIDNLKWNNYSLISLKLIIITGEILIQSD